MDKRVFVAVTNDISTDQRVHKVCEYLIVKGYEITVYGRVLPDTFEVDRRYTIVRKKHWFNNNFLFYAEYNIRLLLYILFSKKYEYIHANDLDTLAASFLGAKLKGSKIIYDSHEYYTETPELQGRKFAQGFWLMIERLFLPRVKNTITVSEPIVKEYDSKYGTKMKLLRNVPSLKRQIIKEEVSFPTKNKVVLYQGVLNPGRGLEPMILALHELEGIDLVIIGFGKVKEQLIQFVKDNNLENRVHFLGRIAYEKLPNYTKIADVGMVLEEPQGKSFEYSLPNKLFDYIHTGIPIISSSLVEVKKIVEKYNVGLVIDNYSPKEIASKVKRLIEDDILRNQLIANQNKAKHELCWESEVKILDTFYP